MAFFASLFATLGLTSTTTAPITGAAAATAASTTTGLAQAAVLGGGVVAPTAAAAGITATEALLATSAISGVAGIAKNIEGQRLEDKQNRVARQALNLRAQRQTRRLIKREQIKRAEIISDGETNTKGGAVSAISGGLGGLAADTAAEQSLVAQTTALGKQATAIGNQVSKSRSQAAIFRGVGAIASQARRSGIFEPDLDIDIEPAVTV